MNIETIAANLRITIQAKTYLLQATFERSEFGTYPKVLEYRGMCKMLENEIDSLELILKDLEQCIGVEECA